MKTPREILLEKHRAAETKLDALRENVLANQFAIADQPHQRRSRNFVAACWEELVVPCRWIWGGMGVAWMVLVAVNLSVNEPSGTMAKNDAPPSSEAVAVLQQQRKLMAQLLQPSPDASAEEPRNLRPRGEARSTIVCV